MDAWSEYVGFVMPIPTFPDDIVSRLAILMVLAVMVLPFMVE